MGNFCQKQRIIQIIIQIYWKIQDVILYKCISKNVNFDINNQNVLTLGITYINNITQLYYDTYKNIGFK